MSSERPEVLVVEDERNLRELFSDVLSGRGITVRAVATLGEAEVALHERLPDALVLDVKLPDGDGIAFLERRRDALSRVPVIVMTAFGTIDRAVQALRAGAIDFLVKPFDNARMVSAVENAIQLSRRGARIELARPSVTPRDDAKRTLVGAEGGLQDLMAVLPRIGASDVTVLVLGESGTGKELVARAIHDASSRRDGPFVSVNCAALPGSLLESELFGFERGAFTGAHARKKGLVEAAEGGTLFLDEIGDMSLDAQARLLRVLQERRITRIGATRETEVDVRVIAATHRNLRERARTGAFREDLWFRLSVVPITLPALRARRSDVPALIEYFLGERSRDGAPVPRPDAAFLEAAAQYPWPGNVRELQNLVERAVVLGRFDPAWVDAGPARNTEQQAPAVASGSGEARRAVVPLRRAVADAERRAILAALTEAGGNKAEAARLLGISYKTLFNKLHEHGIQEQTGFG